MRVHSVALFRHGASGYESERAGTSQGIFFRNFLPTLVRAHFAAFKEWELWIHHDDRVMDFPYFNTLERMHRAKLIKLIPMGTAVTLCGSMLWRMMPLFNPDVEFFISRDVDSLPMHRDREMVDEAIAAGAAVHAILDSESHCGPLMGGMTGYRPSAVRKVFPDINNLAQLLALAPPSIDFNVHGADQRFLNSVIWPRLQRETFIHQRRRDIQYPEAMETKPVVITDRQLDLVVRHIGAGYSVDKAQQVLREHHNHEPIDLLEAVQFPGNRQEPWYVAGAIQWLASRVNRSWNVFESGGGASTIWYADRAQRVVTAEHDPFYRTLIEDHFRSNVTLVDFSYTPTALYDLVAIDGHDRVDAIRRLMPCVKPGGYLLIDNSERPEYAEGLALLKEWERIDYKDAEKEWMTSIWRKA